MATIVKHKRTGSEYILLGINGEENQTNPSRFINELFSQSQAKTKASYSATVCDVRGNLFLAYIDDLIVIEIDGKNPADILPEPSDSQVPKDTYRSPDNEDEEELAEERFEDEFEDEADRDRIIITPPKTTTNSQELQDQSDFDEDDEEWI